MSDHAVRLLERRAAAGDVEAAGELLLLRHQAGALPEERLRLAAHMGDAGAVIAARRLLGVEPKRQGLGPWVRTIGTPRSKDWERELPWVPLVQPVCLRVAIVAAEHGLAVWSSQAWRDGVDPEDGDTRYLEQVLGDAKAWLGRSEPWAGRPMDDPIRQRLWGWNAGEGLPSDVALELSSVVCQPVSPGARAAHAKERDTARSAAFVAERAAQALVWANGKGAEAPLRAAMQQRAVAWLLRTT